MGGRYRRRNIVALGTALTCLFAWCPCAFALDPTLDVSQYVHTSWRVRDGFWGGAINAIAQTADGYLWVGTNAGLLRFDGVKSAPWPAPPNQTLPSQYIVNLLTGRDGTLWIATDKGLASWKDAKLRQYDELAGAFIGRMVEARDGSLWVTVTRPSKALWTLCTIHGGRVGCYGADGGPGANAVGLYEDRNGVLWVGTVDGLWQWKPEPRRFYPLPRQPNGIQGLTEADDGTLLVSMVGGVRRLRNGRAEPAYPFPRPMQDASARSLLRDREGGLWIGTSALGLVHVHQGITDVFAQVDGLSGDSISKILEDREGNIWVATLEGLDRFRTAPAAPFSARQGLSNSRVQSVLATRDGSVWVGTSDGLSRLNGSRVTVYRDRSVQMRQRVQRPTSRDAREITARGLPPSVVASLFQDRLGYVWVSTRRGVGYIENDRFVAVSGLPGGITRAIVEDSRNLWIANQDLGLFQVSADRTIIQRVPWSALNRNVPVSAVAADPSKPGVWLGFPDGGVINFVDGQTRAAYGVADGLGAGFVRSLRLDSDGTLWVATDGGLSRVHDGRVTTLTRTNGLPCDAAQWIVEDPQSFWLGMSCGLVRIARSEIDGWAAVVDKNRETSPTVHTTVFANADAVRLYANANYFSAPAVVAVDGRVWFMSQDGVSVIDPRDVPFNKLPPPVHIEQVIADRKTYDAGANVTGGLRLPPLTRDLQIDYTALSLVAPEKNRFKIKLEGWDREWQDMGNRRQVFYNSLAPRNYRFRVSASNNSGVWNEAGAALEFSVAPAYYQTLWFRLTMVVASVGFLAALYQLRLRRLAWQFNIRLEERVNERTRVARDLHDTLLQSFHAVVLRLQAVTFLPPGEARQALENVIDDAGHAIVEARDAVQGLRSTTGVSTDLPSLISALGEELIASQSDERTPAVSVNVEGSPREIVPLVRDEIYRIAREVLRNAFRHADASRIQVEIRYAPRVLRVRIRDDGKGVDQEVVDGGGRSGHYGLAGMRERAELIKGTLTLWSERGSGTEVELTIPASVAYAKPSTARQSTSSKEAIE